MKPFLLVLSSPSGGGKSTIARELLATRRDLGYSVSATTRSPRQGEEPGLHYHFMTRGEFQAAVERGEFLEWAEYGGNLYGTLRREIDAILGSGRHAVLDIEVRGAAQLRARFSNAVHVFILPPSAGALVDRLRARNTENGGALRTRLEKAVEELGEVDHYDYVVVNEQVGQAVAEIGEIIEAESKRPKRLPQLDGELSTMRQSLASVARSGLAG